MKLIQQTATNLCTPMLDTKHPNLRSIPGVDHTDKEWTRQLLN